VNTSEKINFSERKFFKADLPDFRVGDVVKLRIKVMEADKARIHPFEGTVIRKTGGGMNATFTVRKISFGEGVERTFPLHSPVLESIEVITKGKVSRGRLYYLRGRVGKKTRVKKQEAVAEPSHAA
jgi:large subunit ribosomal protein L19